MSKNIKDGEKKLNNFSDVHAFCFELNNICYLYDFYYDVVIKVTENVKRCYEYILEGNDNYTEFFTEYNFLKELIEIGLLIGEYDVPDYSDKIACISFAPVYGCNFRCSYCFGQYGENYTGVKKMFSVTDMKNVLNVFAKKWFPSAKQYRIDFVSGGEPLLNFELIKETIEYVEEMQKQNMKKFSVWLCTNGSLLNDEICAYLDAHNVSIGVSLDGSRERHNFNRVDINGNGTYDCVVGNIKKILNNKKLSKKFRNLWGLSVISGNNSDVMDKLDHNAKLGLNNIQMKFVRSDKQVLDVRNICHEYYALCEKIFEEFCEGRYDIIQKIANDNDYFGKILKRILLHQVAYRRCRAGVNKITVCPDGTVYPCDSFVGREQFCLGHYTELENIDSIFPNMSVDEREGCKKCQVRYICGGDCFYNSYISNHDVGKPNSQFCEIQKNMIYFCIELKFKMKEFDIDNFEKIKKILAIKDEYMRQS